MQSVLCLHVDCKANGQLGGVPDLKQAGPIFFQGPNLGRTGMDKLFLGECRGAQGEDAARC